MENVGISTLSPNVIFIHGEVHVALSRKHPNGLKAMVCGGRMLLTLWE